MTEQHTLNNTVANGFKQMAPPVRIITVVLDIKQIFQYNKHTHTYQKAATDYIPLSSSQTTSRDAKPTQHIIEIDTSSQHQFKTGVPQGGVLSPTLFNSYTADIPPPREPVQVMAITYIHKCHECSQEIHTTIPT